MRLTRGYVLLAVVYAFLLVTSNILCGKIITITDSITLTAAIIIFPIVYVISDLMTEVYGIRLSMLSIRLNFLCCALFVLLTQIALSLPYPDFWIGQKAYETVFGATPRLVFASLVSYYIGDWINSSIVSWMKRVQKKKNFALRAFVSTVFGQMADSILFFGLGFIGLIPSSIIFTLAVSQFVAKVSYETLCLPITVRVVSWWKKWDRTDVVDSDDFSIYNPISI